MTKEKLILIGAGGHARSCIDVIELQGKFKVTGLVGLNQEVGDSVIGYPVIATEYELNELFKESSFALIAIGQINSANKRKLLYYQALSVGFTLPSIVSPTAYVSPHAKIGSGTIIMHGAIVNAGARVADNCIVNSRALIEHDVTIESHCHISTGAIVNGGAKISEECFIGSGAVVKEGISVGEGSLIGMGLSLRQNLPQGSRYLGDLKI